MAEDKNTRIVEIRVKNDTAIEAMAEYTRRIEEAAKQEKELRKAIRERGSGSEEAVEANKRDREEIARLKEVQTGYKKEIQTISKEVQNNIVAEQTHKNTLKSLGAELSNAKDRLRELTLGTEEYAKQEKKVAELNDRLKEAEAAYGVFSRNVGNYPDVKPLNTQLEEITKTLAQMKHEGRDNTEEFRTMLAEASKMRDAIDDTQKQIAAGASDTAALDGVLQAAQSLAGAYGIWNSMIAANIDENSESAEAMKNLQVAMTALTSLTTVMTVLQKQSALMQNVQKVQTMAHTAAISLNTAAQSKNIVVQKAAIVVQKALNRVAAANPYVLLAVAVGTVVGAFALMASGGRKAKSEVEALSRSVDSLNRNLKRLKGDEDFAVRIAEAAGKSEAEILDIRRKGAKERLEIADRNMAEIQSKYDAASKKQREKMQEDYDKAKALQEEAIADMKKVNEDATVNDVKSRREAEEKKTEELKAAVERHKAARKTELDEVRAAADAEIALMQEGIEKQIKQENEASERKIADLKRRLEEDRTLTMAARAAIEKQIELAERQHAQNLKAIDRQRLEEQIRQEQRTIELKLAAVKTGTEEEYRLQQEQLDKQMEVELMSLTLTEEQKTLIRKKYRRQSEELEQEHLNTLAQKQADAVRLEWENKINEAVLQGQNTLQLQLDQRQAELDALHQLEGESDAEFKARQLEAQQGYADAKQALADYEVQIEEKKIQAVSAIIGGIGGLFEELGEENKEFAVAAKVLAIAEVMIQQGVAMANAIRTATQSSATWVDMLAAIATSVTAVTTTMTTAIKSIKSAKFSTGGYVEGPGTGTSDSVPARLSAGESVNNAVSTSMFAPIYSALNQLGGGIPIVATQSSNQIAGEEMLARAFARGVSMLDMRVGVDEIARVSRRVHVVESLGDI